MARSAKIWAVIDSFSTESPHIKAAFTVRHEMITWIEENWSGASEWEIWSFSDGLSREEPRCYGSVEYFLEYPHQKNK